MTRCVTMSTALKDEEQEKPVKKSLCGSVVCGSLMALIVTLLINVNI